MQAATPRHVDQLATAYHNAELFVAVAVCEDTAMRRRPTAADASPEATFRGVGEGDREARQRRQAPAAAEFT